MSSKTTQKIDRYHTKISTFVLLCSPRLSRRMVDMEATNMINPMPKRVKRITSHVGLARFLSYVESTGLCIPRLAAVPSPYSFGPTHQVYKDEQGRDRARDRRGRRPICSEGKMHRRNPLPRFCLLRCADGSSGTSTFSNVCGPAPFHGPAAEVVEELGMRYGLVPVESLPTRIISLTPEKKAGIPR
jgi:hypothetical protein